MEGAFNRRPIWVRIGVLLAGVAMNFVLAAGLFAVALSLPSLIGHGPLTVVEVQEGSPAAASWRSATSSSRPTARPSSARPT